jgi:predicted HicB family RNase H-like nuclease
MNVMTVDGYNAKIEYDPEIDMFRGAILGLAGGATPGSSIFEFLRHFTSGSPSPLRPRARA